MDASLIEQQEKREKWRESAQTFKKQLAFESALKWTSTEFLAVVDDCWRAGLLSWSTDESAWADLESAAAVIEQLSLIDAALGLMATNQYLCCRAIAHVSDPRIHARIKQRLSGHEPHCQPRWLFPSGDDHQALTFVSAEEEPALVGIGLVREWENSGLALVVAGGQSCLDESIDVAAMGLDVLQFRRIDLKRFFQSGTEARDENCVTWHCTSEEFQRLQKQLDAERSILFSVMLVATAQKACQYALEHSRERRAFGRPICQHQAVMLRLADMAIANESAKLMIADAVTSEPDMRPAAAQRAWIYCREAGISTALQASQLLGGHGYLKLYPLEKWLRDAQSLRILHKAG